MDPQLTTPRRRTPCSSPRKGSVHADGYAWVKYGEKRLTHTKMVREYYRCKNWKEQSVGGTGCRARKVVDRPCEEEPQEAQPPKKFTRTMFPRHSLAQSPEHSEHNHPPLVEPTSPAGALLVSPSAAAAAAAAAKTPMSPAEAAGATASFQEVKAEPTTLADYILQACAIPAPLRTDMSYMASAHSYLQSPKPRPEASDSLLSPTSPAFPAATCLPKESAGALGFNEMPCTPMSRAPTSPLPSPRCGAPAVPTRVHSLEDFPGWKRPPMVSRLPVHRSASPHLPSVAAEGAGACLEQHKGTPANSVHMAGECVPKHQVSGGLQAASGAQTEMTPLFRGASVNTQKRSAPQYLEDSTLSDMLSQLKAPADMFGGQSAANRENDASTSGVQEGCDTSLLLLATALLLKQQELEESSQEGFPASAPAPMGPSAVTPSPATSGVFHNVEQAHQQREYVPGTIATLVLQHLLQESSRDVPAEPAQKRRSTFPHAAAAQHLPHPPANPANDVNALSSSVDVNTLSSNDCTSTAVALRQMATETLLATGNRHGQVPGQGQLMPPLSPCGAHSSSSSSDLVIPALEDTRLMRGHRREGSNGEPTLPQVGASLGRVWSDVGSVTTSVAGSQGNDEGFIGKDALALLIRILGHS